MKLSLKKGQAGITHIVKIVIALVVGFLIVGMIMKVFHVFRPK